MSQQAENMIKVPENGRESVCVEVGSKAPRGSVPKRFQKRGEHKFEKACRKLALVNFGENPRLWRFSSGSQEAENIIKLPENGRKGVFVEVGAKAIRGSVAKAFQKRGEHNVEQACTKLVPVDCLKILGFGDLVQCPRRPKI